MTTLAARLGRVIQRLRREKGLSQEKFAQYVGVHRTYMGAVERGEKNLSIKSAEKIARGLGVKLSFLIEEAERARS